MLQPLRSNQETEPISLKPGKLRFCICALLKGKFVHQLLLMGAYVFLRRLRNSMLNGSWLIKQKKSQQPKTFVCYGRLGAFLHIVLLLCLVPVTILFILIKCIQSWVYEVLGKDEGDPKFIQGLQNCVLREGRKLKTSSGDGLVMLISGAHFGKTLTVMRSIKTVQPEAKIILTDSSKYALNGARFSCHCDAFEAVNSEPELDKKAYAEELLKIAQKYDVTGFLPVSKPRGAEGDALACELIAKHCRQFNRSYHLSSDLCALLDNKHAFCDLCQKLDLSAPKAIILSSEDETLKLNQKMLKPDSKEHPMIIKNLSYDPLHRLDLFTIPAPVDKLQAYLDKIRKDGNPITSSEPWIAQTKLSGKEYSAAMIIRNGEIRLLTISPSSASQLQFKHMSHEKIQLWVEKFVSRYNKEKAPAGRGLQNCQICIDFIEVESTSLSAASESVSDLERGQTEVYPIECNCRVHSQFSVFSTSDVGRAVLGSALLGVDNSRTLDFDFYNHRDSKSNKNGFFSGSASMSALASPISKSLIAARIAGKTFHYADELFKLLRVPNYGHQRLSLCSILGERMQDADLDLSDPWPFFCKIHLQIPSLLVYNLFSGKFWKKIDFCIGKVVEIDGE